MSMLTSPPFLSDPRNSIQPSGLSWAVTSIVSRCRSGPEMFVTLAIAVNCSDMAPSPRLNWVPNASAPAMVCLSLLRGDDAEPQYVVADLRIGVLQRLVVLLPDANDHVAVEVVGAGSLQRGRLVVE